MVIGLLVGCACDPDLHASSPAAASGCLRTAGAPGGTNYSVSGCVLAFVALMIGEGALRSVLRRCTCLVCADAARLLELQTRQAEIQCVLRAEWPLFVDLRVRGAGVDQAPCWPGFTTLLPGTTLFVVQWSI